MRVVHERQREREIFPAFHRSRLDGPRIKVGPHNEIYAWVPKSECFVKLKKVAVLFYFGYSLSKGHPMAMRQ